MRWAMLGLVVLAGCATEVDDPEPRSGGEWSITTVERPSTTSAATETTGTSRSTTSPEPVSITLAGDGKQNTEPFALPAGAYEASYDYRAECTYYGDLRPSDGGYLFDADVGRGSGPVSGTTNLYDIDEGSYYVRMNTGPAPRCPWTVTLTLRRDDLP